MKRILDDCKLRCRFAALLLLEALLVVLLWGCAGGSGTPILEETKETSAPVESELLDTMDKAVAYVEETVRSGAETFSLVCSQEVYDALIKVTYNGNGMERKAFHCLLEHAGVYDCSAVTAGMKNTITVSDIRLYSGYEILRSVENGEEDQLPSKLKKTLAQARSMADTCQTSDPLETAKNIQSAICSHVRYANMTNQSDADTAAGALLNGTADCDGYADAFYLVGRLAGLDVRYQQGTSFSYDLVENKIVTGSHMWNLLKIDGSWRVVDVCWADGENGIDYTWFNIGKDRASRSRSWQEDLSVPLLEVTDLSARPETEYSVTNRETLEAALKEAIEKKQNTFIIIFDSENYISRTDAFAILGDFYAGEIYYYWDACTRALTFILDDAGG